MSDFFVSYLSIGLAIIFLGLGFWVKRNWLFFVGAFCWVVVGLYSMSRIDPTEPLVALFAVFCGAMAILMFALPFMLKERVKEVPLDDDSFNETLEELRKERDGIDNVRRGSRR